MISILILNLLITLTFSAVQQQCRGDPSLNVIVDGAQNSVLQGIIPDVTPQQVFGNLGVAEWVLDVLDYATFTPYLQISGNNDLDNPKYQPARLQAQKMIFTEGRMERRQQGGPLDHLTEIPTTVYAGGDTQMCWADPSVGRYYFGKTGVGGVSELCTPENYNQYGGKGGLVNFVMIQNKCTAADDTMKAFGPIAGDDPLFDATDIANPVAEHTVLKKAEENKGKKKSKKRILQIYSDGTMAYFEGDTQPNHKKGEFLRIGAPIYVDGDLAPVDNEASATYLSVPRRRYYTKDKEVQEGNILFKKDAGVDALNVVKAAIESVNAANMLDAVWNTKCGQCNAKFINLAIPVGGQHFDKFDASLDGFVEFPDQFGGGKKVEISSIEGYNTRSFGVVIILVVLSFIFVAYSFCGKANKEDDAYAHLIEQEI